MPILNYQLETVGESGQLPKFIYINTNDTSATVVNSGYLNVLAVQGVGLSTSQVALVTTQADSGSAPTSNIYHVMFSSGNWSLTPASGSSGGSTWNLGGNSVTGPQVFGTLSDAAIYFKSNAISYMDFDPDVLRLQITANNFKVQSSSTADISASNGVTIDSAVSVTIGGAVSPEIVVGNSDPACKTIVVSPVVQMPNIPKSNSTSLLFFNEADGTVTFDTVNDNLQYWKINANNTESSLQFGTPNAAGWTYIVNGVSVGSVGSSGKLQWNADFGVSADKTVNMLVGNPTPPGPVSAHSLVVKAVGIFSGQGQAGSQLIAIGGDASVTSVVGQASLSGDTISITGTGGNTGPSGSNVYLHSAAGIVRIESETDVVTILAGDRVFANSANETKLVSQALVTLGSNAPGCVLSLDVTASTMTFNATNGYTIVNVPAQVPTAGAPTNVPPANWEYLIVDTTTGAIGRFPSN